jgi:hypothetical protein
MSTVTATGLPGSGSRAALAGSAWPALLTALAVWTLAVLVNWPLKLDHDEAYFLASGRILNEGSRLYTDWMDFNTPAPSGVARWSAWLASVLQTPLDLTHKATIYLLTFAGLGVAFAVLLPELRKPGPSRWILAIGLTTVLMFATPEIGRREQMFCIGALGWIASILLAARDVQRPWPIAALAGLAAGLALYEKPHFILFAVVLGLVDLLRARGQLNRVLLSTWVAAAVSIALYAWLLLANPDFLNVVLPATVDLYRPLGMGWQMAAEWLAGSSALRAFALALIAFVLVRGMGSRPPWIAVAIAASFVVSAALLYVQQGFGFEYHRLPLDIAFNSIALGLLMWALDNRWALPKQRLHLGGILAAGLVFLAALGSQLVWVSRYPHRDSISNSELLQAMRPPAQGDPILIITTDVEPSAEILVQLDARWSGDFISLFPIPALIRQDGRDGLAEPLPEEKRQYWTRWFMDKVAGKFCADPPVRIAVEITDRPTFFQRPGFDMLAWLRDDPEFNACWVAARLSPVGSTIDYQHRSYQVYAAN